MTIWRAAIMAAGFVALGATSAAAQGLADIHEHVRVGNKICFKDHFHDGSSANQPSRKAAEAEAVKVWRGFTGWEYGAQWGSFRLAESKRVNCSGADKAWSCQVAARPCRRR
jgi:hypothetical protein